MTNSTPPFYLLRPNFQLRPTIKQIVLVLLCVFFDTLSAKAQINNDSSTTNSSTTLRILSFNILHGATTRGDFDLDVIAKVITDAHPDLVALQEVDRKTNRAHALDLALELGWKTKMVALFGKAMPYDGGEYGEALLSNYSIIQSRNIPLPHALGSEPRTALEILVELPSTDTIAFVGTHLDHLKEEKDRIAQALKINEVFSKNKYPTLLVGDLNTIPESPPINILEEMWTATYDKSNPAATYPSSAPTRKLDYVMYYPKNKWKVLETRVIQDTIASDHCAYLVTLELVK